MSNASAISTDFIWRRVHSLMGFWLVLYLVEHLLVNSQAALWIGDDGSGFVRMVNSLESLPYLQVVETVFIGIPLAIHAIWGIRRALQARLNSFHSDGSTPALPYKRNRCFTWQRLTSWILLFGIVGHVVQMRFLEHPKEIEIDGHKEFLTRLTFDEGLYTLAARLGVVLYSAREIGAMQKQREELSLPSQELRSPESVAYQSARAEKLQVLQKNMEEQKRLEELTSFHLKERQVVAVASTPGTAMLLMVRDTFKKPLFAALYSIFVLAAAFHAFNGFWTFLLTWGVILSYRSQKAMGSVSVVGIALLAFLGLAAIWGSYWINLRY